MNDVRPRMRRERKTVEAMIALYCRWQHGTRRTLCDDCAELADYVRLRLQKGPFSLRQAGT